MDKHTTHRTVELFIVVDNQHIIDNLEHLTLHNYILTECTSYSQALSKTKKSTNTTVIIVDEDKFITDKSKKTQLTIVVSLDKMNNIGGLINVLPEQYLLDRYVSETLTWMIERHDIIKTQQQAERNRALKTGYINQILDEIIELKGI